MRERGSAFVCLSLLIPFVFGDVYLHNPRGSNNRLNERSANRDNANRLFDSQNNNRGGYNAGDTEPDGQAFNNEKEIYYEKYFMSRAQATPGTNNGQSLLFIEWTNQHGCGGNEDTDPHKLNCNLVLQFMCQEGDESDNEAFTVDSKKLFLLRNGNNRNTQNHQPPNSLDDLAAARDNVAANQVQATRGLHEPYSWYDDCYVREANGGLFLADQNLANNKFGYSSAIYTRQNPNGNRRGYECPEERDYYPYWHPTPWRDIAVFTSNTSHCGMYRSESHNVKPKHICYETGKSFSRWNNQEDCENNGGEWFAQYNYLEIQNLNQQQCEDTADGFTRVWAKARPSESERCLVLLKAPDCRQAPWSRSNHLGNGRDGVPLNYTWVLPYFPSMETQRCVFRIRYNISTDDYDPWNTNSSYNEENGGVSPITQNPNVNIGSTTNKPLRLAINTAQFGRTFQDRSHVFILRARPVGLEDTRIYNLNVRGKRGNIVQVYPAVEYDFIPNRLEIKESDAVHFQWTGSNTHNNGAPGGDGQTGDAGEGQGGTDRSNIVETLNETVNYPMPWHMNTMFQNAQVLWTSGYQTPSAQDLAVFFASAGYFQCIKNSDCGSESVETKTALNVLLNNATPSFEGAVLRFAAGKYYYICTRNNNFTNRSQKGRIIVTS